MWEQRRTGAHTEAVRALDVHVKEAENGPPQVRWVSAGDDKLVIVWDDKGGAWEKITSLSHVKKVTAAVFDSTGSVVFGDRFGDVFRWNLKEEVEPELLFTHLAIVTAMTFVENGKFLVSADNHEKIRISCYPLAAEIHSFCLGHTCHITALAPARNGMLLSAAADGFLRLWLLDGTPVAACNLDGSASCIAVHEDSVVCGFVASPGMRRARMVECGESIELQLLDAPLSGECPQAVCLQPSLDLVLFIDNRGHLRVSSATTGGEWSDIFDGEDVPSSHVLFMKNVSWLEEDMKREALEEDGDEAPNKKKSKKP